MSVLLREFRTTFNWIHRWLLRDPCGQLAFHKVWWSHTYLLAWGHDYGLVEDHWLHCSSTLMRSWHSVLLTWCGWTFLYLQVDCVVGEEGKLLLDCQVLLRQLLLCCLLCCLSGGTPMSSWVMTRWCAGLQCTERQVMCWPSMHWETSWSSPSWSPPSPTLGLHQVLDWGGSRCLLEVPAKILIWWTDGSEVVLFLP